MNLSRPHRGAARRRVTAPSARCLAAMISLAAALTGCRGGPDAKPVLTGFAAASLMAPLGEIGPAFEARHAATIRFDFASSGILRMKIEAGAWADFFLAAGAAPMDSLEANGLIRPASRTVFLGNRLVAVVPAGRKPAREPRTYHPQPGGESFLPWWHPLLRWERIAIGDPDHVPEGLYAREALERLGLWETLGDRVVPCPDARAVLLQVEGGNVDGGIVYASDAHLSEGVEILAVIPEETHDPILYPAAVLTGSAHPELAARFLEELASDAAREIFRRHGFLIPREGTAE